MRSFEDVVIDMAGRGNGEMDRLARVVCGTRGFERRKQRVDTGKRRRAGKKL